MDALGILRIRVRQGINLAVRDTRSSDPYVVVSCGAQTVYDKDTFTKDDSMGNAEIDIKPFIECVKMGLQGLPDGAVVGRAEVNSGNCLAEVSCIVWNKGKLTQDITLRLRDTECGELQIQIECLDYPGGRGLKN